jgi:hypothetical protein
MVAFSSLALGLSTLAASLAVPTEPTERGDYNFFMGPDHPLFARRNLTARSNTNFNQDYVTGGTVNYSPTTNGFSVSWNTQQDFVVGVGWQPGSTAYAISIQNSYHLPTCTNKMTGPLATAVRSVSPVGSAVSLSTAGVRTHWLSTMSWRQM